MYPNTLTMDKAVLDLFELRAELKSLKSTMSEKNVINLARVINNETEELNPQMSWPPKEDDFDRTRDYISHLLRVFLTILVCGKSHDNESSNTES